MASSRCTGRRRDAGRVHHASRRPCSRATRTSSRPRPRRARRARDALRPARRRRRRAPSAAKRSMHASRCPTRPRHERDLAPAAHVHLRRRGRLPRRTQEGKPVDEVRALLRDPGGAPVGRGQRAPRLQGHARAGGVRRALRLGRILDRRAPLPRGVLALFESGSAVRRDRGAHLAHAARLWRAADAEAVQPSGAHGRVGRGARPALRRPRRLRHRPLLDASRNSRASASTRPRRAAMWQEAIQHVVGCWTNDEYAFAGKHWQMPKRRVLPKPLQNPHPPIWGATSSEDGHRQIGAARARALFVRGRRAARRGEEEDRHLPRRRSRAARRRSASGCTTRRPPSR